jgi:hypothetical protein
MRMTILLLCAAVFLSGCISISSGERTVREETVATPTLGQQLMDLKADYVEEQFLSKNTTSGGKDCCRADNVDGKVKIRADARIAHRLVQ